VSRSGRRKTKTKMMVMEVRGSGRKKGRTEKTEKTEKKKRFE
jgi:nitrogen regulatory protein PII